MAQWEFVDQRIEESGAGKKHNFSAIDLFGDDQTEYLLNYPGFVFLVIAHDLEKAGPEKFNKVIDLNKEITQHG